MNPLKVLIDRMGLTAPSLVKCGMKEMHIESALDDAPREPLATYVKIMNALEVKSRILADRPFALWFDASAIDDLRYSEVFREFCGLSELPKDRGELRRIIRLMKKHGSNLGDIKEHMEKNFIPTASGLKNWRRSTIAQNLKGRCRGVGDEEMELGINGELRQSFREYAMGNVIVEMCPYDGFSQVRYDIRWTESSGRIYVSSKTNVPAALRRWTVIAINALNWFDPQQWGEGEQELPPVQIDGVSGGVSGVNTLPLVLANGPG